MTSRAARHKAVAVLGVALGTSVVTASCGQDVINRRTESPVVRDSSGVRIVSNTGSDVWPEGAGWQVATDLTIGEGVSGAAEYQFGRITDIDVDRAGRILVLDEQAFQVRVFESDGHFAFAFGRAGRGPGEFSIDMFALRVDSSGSIAVRDGINRRDHVFDSRGNFIRAVALTARRHASAALSDGSRIDRVSSGDTWDGLLRISPGEELADTIVTFEYDIAATRGFATQRRTSDGRVEIALLPSHPIWATTSDGRVASALDSQYRIEVRRPDGRLALVIQKGPVTAALGAPGGQLVLDRLRQLMRDGGMSEEQVAESFRQFDFVPPTTMPPIARLVGGSDGTLWVQRTLPIDRMTASPVMDALLPGGPVWDIFDRDGEFLGSVTLPPRFTLKRIRAQFAYGVYADELDVQRVVRLVVRRP